MTRHLAKLLDMIWYASIGLFLGLHAGTILAVVETFDSSRKIDATPGLMPYADPHFADTHNEIVAGFIAQNVFKNGGVVVLVLLGVALLSRFAYPLLVKLSRVNTVGSIRLGRARLLAMMLCAGFMAYGTQNMMQMNQDWPKLYHLKGDLAERRADFDARHKISERVVGGAWFVGAFALVISPWCRRIADSPLQSGDGKEEVNEEKVGPQKA
ncbi:MAG: hypothetical protein AB8C95_08315 [Phycisphaeraceae bacterium]